MNNALADDIVAFAQSDGFVAFLYVNFLNVAKLVTQLILLQLLCFDLFSKCLILDVLLNNFLASARYAFFSLADQRHHSIDLGNQDVSLFLLGLSVLIFSLDLCVLEFADFGLERLVSVINLRSFFLSLLKFFFKSSQRVLVLFLLLLSFFKLESF